MHKNDLRALLLTFVGIGSLATDASFGKEIATIAGTGAPIVLAIVGVVGSVAAQILRVQGAPTQ